MRPSLTVEIWSDVVCPWCYIGKRRWEAAAATLRDDVDLAVVYRPFQLDPSAPIGVAMPVIDAYARKFGGEARAGQLIEHLTSTAAAEGLEFRLDRALRSNTLLAHRLLWLAEAIGAQEQLKERLLRAYFCDGLDIGDPATLAQCAADVGMEREAVTGFLASDDGVEEVRSLMASAADAGITAVPTFVFDRRWMVPGAQDTDVFVRVVQRLLSQRELSHLAEGSSANG